MQYIVRDLLPVKEFPLITPSTEWPVFFATAMYVFEGIGLVRTNKQRRLEKRPYD